MPFLPRLHTVAAAVLAAASLSSCAGPVTMAPQGSSVEVQQEIARQRELVFENQVRDQMRVSQISYPLLKANAEFCRPSTGPLMGMSLWNLGALKAEYRQAATNVYGLTNRLTVRDVARHSPAAAAGLRAGDVIISVGGATLPEGAQALKLAADVFKRNGAGRTDLVVQRAGKAVTTSLQPTEGCAFPVLLDYSSNQINAYADGEKIVISKGILRFAENDNEVAMVIAHELAHSALRHVDKIRQNASIGMFGGLAIDGLLAAAGVGTGGQFSQLGGAMAMQRYSVPFEQEADYVGMYFMERAGYNAAGVANFWRRMGAEGQGSLTQASTHPTSPERFLAIERTWREIQEKKKTGKKLVPNMQAGR